MIPKSVLCIVTLAMSLLSSSLTHVYAETSPFWLGVGGYELCQHKEGVSIFPPECQGQRIPLAQELSKTLPEANTVTLWITRDWEEYWYDPQVIQSQYIDKGITPIFMFYWFADEISPAFVAANENAYRQDLAKFTRFLKQLKGHKKVILDPEFNQNGISDWDAYNDFLIASMAQVREADDVAVSFCIGDFGIYTNLDDRHNFTSFHTSIARAAQHADFISFQEMRALTRNSAEDIRLTPERTLAFATSLHNTYNKPTYLAYVAISSLGPQGNALQQGVFQGFADLLPRFRQQAGLLGLAGFHYTDIPHHVGYFLEGEACFGIMDKNGRPKPAYSAFRNLGKAAGLR